MKWTHDWEVVSCVYLFLCFIFENAWSYNSTPQNAFMAWCPVKKKYKDYFTFTFTFTAQQISIQFDNDYLH
jgi:hypothetical protein